MPEPKAAIEKARALVQAATRIVAFTGAGVSAESGVPTFRGTDGLWGKYRAEDLATPEAFDRDPRLVWEWYAMRRGAALTCVPNAAHQALATAALSRELTIVTQNVDGLHARAARAAPASRDPERAMPFELHGSILRDRCSGCDRRSEPVNVDARELATLPRCTSCRALLRPDVVWFGEMLDVATLSAADRAAAAAGVCLVIGTSALVYPAAGIPLRTLERGGAIIEVNVDETPLTRLAAVSVRGKAAEVVPLIVAG